MAAPLREDMETFTPSAASALATANPKPLLAPETSATLSFSPRFIADQCNKAGAFPRIHDSLFSPSSPPVLWCCLKQGRRGTQPPRLNSRLQGHRNKVTPVTCNSSVDRYVTYHVSAIGATLVIQAPILNSALPVEAERSEQCEEDPSETRLARSPRPLWRLARRGLGSTKRLSSATGECGLPDLHQGFCIPGEGHWRQTRRCALDNAACYNSFIEKAVRICTSRVRTGRFCRLHFCRDA